VKRRSTARPKGRRSEHPPHSEAWISVKVELVQGGGEHLWPRPGRLFAVSGNHKFGQLSAAIDDAFARWDRSHLHEFEFKDGTRIGIADPDDDELLDEQHLNLSRLKPGDHFIYVFDLGDDWAHLCTIGSAPIDPVETFGLVPDRPLPYFGWGTIPDQYGRAWSDDDGASPLPPDRS
jgi:pRiA4b ORF-3-like protein